MCEAGRRCLAPLQDGKRQPSTLVLRPRLRISAPRQMRVSYCGGHCCLIVVCFYLRGARASRMRCGATAILWSVGRVAQYNDVAEDNGEYLTISQINPGRALLCVRGNGHVSNETETPQGSSGGREFVPSSLLSLGLSPLSALAWQCGSRSLGLMQACERPWRWHTTSSASRPIRCRCLPA